MTELQNENTVFIFNCADFFAMGFWLEHSLTGCFDLLHTYGMDLK